MTHLSPDLSDAELKQQLLSRHQLDQNDLPGIETAADTILQAMKLEPLLSSEGRARQLALMDGYLARLAAITADRRRYPEIADVVIKRPIFITGLGRSGTTFLHSLLSRDSRNRCPLVWETIFPSPPPEAATYDSDPRIEQCAKYFANNPANPKDDSSNADMQRKHLTGPLLTEEDNALLRTSLRGVAMGSGPRILAYFHWLLQQDMRPAYEIHKRWLQHLQWRNPRERWVLKAPTHIHNLPALFSVYPDAQLVQCHRHPAEVISSMTSLLVTYRRSFMTTIDPPSIALELINYWSSGLVRCMAYRRANPHVPFFDIGHKAIVGDPLVAVEQIYGHFGIELTRTARAELEAFVHENPQDKHGGHHHNIERFGLSEARVSEIFAGYIEQYRAYI